MLNACLYLAFLNTWILAIPIRNAGKNHFFELKCLLYTEQEHRVKTLGELQGRHALRFRCARSFDVMQLCLLT